MIIVLKANRSEEQVKNFISNLTDRYDVSVNTWVGTHSTVLGLIGDTAAVDSEYIAAQDIVESVKRVQEPYKKANRKFHPEDTVIKLPTGQVIGDGSLALIAVRAPSKAKRRSAVSQSASRPQALRSCAAAHSSPAPRRMRSRVLRQRASSSSKKPRKEPACPSSPRL